MRQPPLLGSAIIALALLTATAAPAEAHDAEEVLELHMEDLEAFGYTLALAGGRLTSAMLIELIESLEANAALYSPPLTRTATAPSSSSPNYTIGESAEAWRPLVAAYFDPGQVDYALAVLWCESRGDPNAANPTSSARGLFQHLERYWPERSSKAGWSGYSIFDPEANVAVAAWLSAGGTGWHHWTCRP